MLICKGSFSFLVLSVDGGFYGGKNMHEVFLTLRIQFCLLRHFHAKFFSYLMHNGLNGETEFSGSAKESFYVIVFAL